MLDLHASLYPGVFSMGTGRGIPSKSAEQTALINIKLVKNRCSLQNGVRVKLYSYV